MAMSHAQCYVSSLDAPGPSQPTILPSELQEKAAFAWNMDIPGFCSLWGYVATAAPSANTAGLAGAL